LGRAPRIGVLDFPCVDLNPGLLVCLGKGKTMRLLSLATLLALAVCLASAANAAMLNIVGGQLIGASNVDVGGGLYDVVFTDGTCIALFSGCDSNSDFAFTTEAAGLAAACEVCRFESCPLRVGLHHVGHGARVHARADVAVPTGQTPNETLREKLR
jgi:hypothetical protein